MAVCECGDGGPGRFARLVRAGRDFHGMRKETLLESVPPGVTTWIVPVLAPAGRVVEIPEGLTTVNAADIPLNVTLVAAVKSVPKISTTAPPLRVLCARQPKNGT